MTTMIEDYYRGQDRLHYNYEREKGNECLCDTCKSVVRRDKIAKTKLKKQLERMENKTQ